MGRARGEHQTLPALRRGQKLPLGLVEARAEDYARFLVAFVQAGGRPTSYYDSFARELDLLEDWYVACRDFRMQPLYGASLIRVVVPEHVRYEGGERGHSSVYQVARPLEQSYNSVPAFGDLPLDEVASGYLLEQVQAAVSVARFDQEVLERQLDDLDRQYELESAAARSFFTERTRPSLRAATAADYQRFLDGHKAQGGSPTDLYDYPMPVDRFFVAERDFELPPHGLYGANYVSIIVPKGVQLLGGNPGHCDLFFEDGYTTGDRGFPFVPGYADAR